jgi:hypothetical protein
VQNQVTTSDVQYCGAGFSLPGETRLDPKFSAPTEHVGMSADAAGKSACATSTSP